jgi:RNA polymerase sigma-70 factor (ECF subfamily)
MTDAALSDRELYEKHADELLRFAATLVHPADAEDVMSSAVLKALAAPTWPTVRNRRAYLFRCVVNEARQLHRGRSRRRLRETRWQAGERQTAELQASEIDDVLDELTPRQRAVVHLVYWEGLSGAEVAGRLGMSEGTVRRHLHRAKKNARRRLA